jgi:hypothetical protein
MCEKAHVAPHVAGKAWVDNMKSFRGVIDSEATAFALLQCRLWSPGRSHCICEQTLGDLQWLDKLSLPPQIGWQG